TLLPGMCVSSPLRDEPIPNQGNSQDSYGHVAGGATVLCASRRKSLHTRLALGIAFAVLASLITGVTTIKPAQANGFGGVEIIGTPGTGGNVGYGGGPSRGGGSSGGGG